MKKLQAVTKQRQREVRLRRRDHPTTVILRLAWAIPLAPADLIPVAIDDIEEQARAFMAEYPRVMDFVE